MIRSTAAITAASIAGVIISGGAAVGANIGILNAADDSDFGNLSAESSVGSTTSTTESGFGIVPITEVELEPGAVQSFTVDVAGEVEVGLTESGVYLASVRTNQGWSWQEETSTEGTLFVSFTLGNDKLVFSATGNDDGTINASVDRPAPAPSSVIGTTYDDDDHYDDHDDDDDDHDDDEEDEEDEEDEYEGHDDDD